MDEKFEYKPLTDSAFGEYTPYDELNSTKFKTEYDSMCNNVSQFKPEYKRQRITWFLWGFIAGIVLSTIVIELVFFLL